MRIFTILLLVCLPLFMASQNVVPDPGFEEYKYCPVTFNQGYENYFKVWKQPTKGSSDYFNSCSRIVGTPKNEFGYQRPRSGEGYAGLVTFSPTQKNYREYIQVKLKHPLRAGQMYCLQAYISLADHSNFMADGFGIFVSQQEARQQTDHFLPFLPQVQNPLGHVIREEQNWWDLSGTYTANGGEQYIVIGNFAPDNKLSINRRNVEPEWGSSWELAYYFVDDVTVIPVNSREDCTCTADLISELMVNPGLEDLQFSEVQTESVLFDFDKKSLTNTSEKQLNRIARMMAANANYYLQISGHTDIVGPDAYNDTLSLERAESVLAFLKEKGIEKHRLSIKYYGSSKPVATNKKDEGRSLNRRVDFVILKRNYENFYTH